MTNSYCRPYEEPVNPAEVNMSVQGLSKVEALFKHQQSIGAFPGGQLVIRRQGQLVLNLATGLARGFQKTDPTVLVPVTPETPFAVYSAGKPFFAIALAILEERGLVHLESEVSQMIPEFAEHGKADITLLDLLTHRAGLIVPTLQRHYHQMEDHKFLLQEIIDAKPMYPRGTFAYMPWESGTILCEVVRRLIGKTMSEFITEEIILPLELSALSYGVSDRTRDQLAYSYWLGKDKCMIASCNVAENFEEIFNSQALFNSKNPAFSMVTDAASLAIFYEFLLNKGLTRSGQRLISEEMIQKYIARSVWGWNRSLGTLLATSRGFMLGGKYLPSVYGLWNTAGCFGHAGALSSLAFGDQKTGLAVAITTNGNRSIPDFTHRFMALVSRIRNACS